MKIKKFEDLNLNISNGYTEEIENQIKKFDLDKEKIRYFVVPPGEKINIHSWGYFHSLEKALDQLNNYKDRCIIECKVKALTNDDIDMYLSQKKYNL